jgi:uncharacterized protein
VQLSAEACSGLATLPLFARSSSALTFEPSEGKTLAEAITLAVASAVDEALIETFRRIYTSIQHGDSDELTSSLAHDIEFVLPESLPWGGPHHGPLGVAAMVEIYRDHVDGSWADPDEFVEGGDRVVVLGRLTGKARSSGQRFEVPFAHVWGLSEGVPSRLRAYYDSAPITAALEGTGS